MVGIRSLNAQGETSIMDLILYVLMFCGYDNGQCTLFSNSEFTLINLCSTEGDKVRGTRSHAFADAHTTFTLPSGMTYKITYLACPADPV